MPPPEPNGPVTILGAGIVGICTALSLLERGQKVRLIDRGAPGQETSMGNAGVVSPWSIVPQAMPGIWRSVPKLMFGTGRPLSIHPRSLPRMVFWGARFLRQSRLENVNATVEAMSLLCAPGIDLYRTHLEGTGHENLLRDSMYVHAFRDGNKANLNALEYRIRSSKGAEMEVIGRDELAKTEPALSTDFQAAVLVKGQARALSPGRIGHVLAEKARSLGAVFHQTEISSLRKTDGGWTIECSNETFTASQVVLAMGVWSGDVLRDLGLRLPLTAERGYHIECTDPGITLNNSVMDVDAKVVASSMETGLRVAGQAEFAPIDAPPNQKRQKQLKKIALAAFPELSVANTRFWMGRRPSFPDSLPVLGELPSHKGLFLNFGHSHYGLMMAPKSGDLLAQIITGAAPNIDLSAFAASRFLPSLKA